MENLKALVRRVEFHGLLFFIGLLLFLRPLLAMSEGEGPGVIQRLVFWSWAFFIVALWGVSLVYQEPGDAPASDDGEDLDDD